jgi:hypothetical protein
MADRLPTQPRQKRHHWSLETWYPGHLVTGRVRARRHERRRTHCASRNLDLGFPTPNGLNDAPCSLQRMIWDGN